MNGKTQDSVEGSRIFLFVIVFGCETHNNVNKKFPCGTEKNLSALPMDGIIFARQEYA